MAEQITITLPCPICHQDAQWLGTAGFASLNCVGGGTNYVITCSTESCAKTLWIDGGTDANPSTDR